MKPTHNFLGFPKEGEERKRGKKKKMGSFSRSTGLRRRGKEEKDAMQLALSLFVKNAWRKDQRVALPVFRGGARKIHPQ